MYTTNSEKKNDVEQLKALGCRRPLFSLLKNKILSGRAPKSVVFGFEDADVTGGAGQTLGPLLTLTKDFSKLSETCP